MGDTPHGQQKDFPFEATLEKLEGIVETMESGDLSLEESLRAFEEGIHSPGLPAGTL